MRAYEQLQAEEKRVRHNATNKKYWANKQQRNAQGLFLDKPGTEGRRKHRRSVKPGGRVHKKGAGKREYTSVRQDEMGEVTEHTVMMPHNSHYWTLRLNECDAFSDVTVYDAEGHVVRTIAREQLIRPWAERVGNTFNTCLFPKRNGDTV